MQKPSRTNVVLATTTMALAFALGAQMGGSGAMPAASARPEDTTTPPFNAAEQRKQTVIQLADINKRLQSIEQKLTAGLSVKITEMPDVKIKEPGKR